VHDTKKIKQLLIDVFMQSRDKEPEEIILDLDTTDDRIHGKQEGRYYHGYYDCYCYLPLYIFCGNDLLCAKLNTSDKGAGKDALIEVSRIVNEIRKKWKNVQIMLRGDSDFSKDDLMSWCEENGINYVFGMRKNPRLLKELNSDSKKSRREIQYKKRTNTYI